MKSFKKYIDAESYAMEVSKRELKSISIVHLHSDKPIGSKLDFTVMDKKDEWFWGIRHVMLISNYETPFTVHSTSPKSGKHIEGFATKELADICFKKHIENKYRKDVYRVDLTHEQYLEQWVTPFQRSKEISDEYRLTLINR